MKKEAKILRKRSIPQGRSVKVNLKISDFSLETFKDLKARHGCKTASEVFSYIYDFAETSLEDVLKPKKQSSKNRLIDMLNDSRRQRTFTINEFTLSWLKKLAKSLGLKKADDVVEASLLSIRGLWELAKLPEYRKYEKRDYTLNVIMDIWNQVTELKYGLDHVFGQEYDADDPENYNYSFKYIEGGLDDLSELVPKLFDEKPKKQRKK